MKRFLRYIPPVVLLAAILAAALWINANGAVKGLGAWFDFAFVSTFYFLAWNVRYFGLDVTGGSRSQTLGPSWNPGMTAQNLQAKIAAGQYKNLVSQDQAILFATVVAAPDGGVQQRIVEEYEPMRHALRKHVTVNVRIPDEMFRALKGKDLLIPIAVSTESITYDDLKVFGVDGAKVSTLTDSEHIRAVSCILHLLLSSVRGRGLLAKAPRDLPSVEMDAFSDFICHVGMEAEHPHSGLNTAQKIRSLIAVSDAKSRQVLRSAAAVVLILTSRRCKIVRIPTPEAPVFSFRYECTLAAMVDPGGWWLWKLKDPRSALRSKTVRIWLNNAAFCQSYHAMIRTSDNLYSTCQKISPAGYLNIPRSSNIKAPYIRLRHRFGQPYVSLYGRYLQVRNINQAGAVPPINQDESPELVADFAEVPPGSLFVATLAAATSAVLIWVAAISAIHAAKDGTATHITDFPLLILAFPGVAAAWLGFDMTDSKMFEGSLIARLSLGFTALISLLAAVLYIGFSAKSIPEQGQLMTLGIANHWWWALTVAAIVNAVLLGFLWLLNWWRYGHFRKNADSAQTG
jgi:hypothetical protein